MTRIWGWTWPDQTPIYEIDGRLWLDGKPCLHIEHHTYQRCDSDVIHAADGYQYYTVGDWIARHGANAVWARHPSYRGWRRLDPDTARSCNGGITVQYDRLMPIGNNVIFLSEVTLVSIDPR